MKTSSKNQRGRGGMELLEEAVHLLRMNVTVLPAYYFGSLPFILALLYFWSDMSRSPFAAQHLPDASLGLAILFIWMKFWHAIFANALRARIAATPPSKWTPRRVLRVLLVQLAIQPTALIILPLAVLPLVMPLAWVYAFYQNVTALADGETSEISKVFRRAWRQALLWPAQNYVALLLLAGFSIYVSINLLTVAQATPFLLKMFFGIESVYSRSPLSMLNTTFFAGIFCLTYLCVDPVIKTVYALRCFYGEAVDSGEDLKVELRQFTPSRQAMLACILICFCLLFSSTANAANGSSTTPTKPVVSTAIPAQELDQTISDVIHQSKYAWRMPREKPASDDVEGESLFVRFVKMCFHWVERAAKWIGHKIEPLFKWIGNLLNKLFGGKRQSSLGDHSGSSWMASLRVLCIVLLAAACCALIVLIYRIWSNSYRRIAPVKSEPIPPTLDLADENTGADQLPEDGWLKMGRELLGRGELRLALRAFYFASLTHLAARNLITIAKFKSNRDYERELGRRGHALPTTLLLFGENVSIFDRSWYGLHEVNQTLVEKFLTNLENMRAGA